MSGPIPDPFVGVPRVSGYDYGAPLPPGGWNGNGLSYGWTWHQGVDYGTRPGQPIIAPFGGTVKFEQGLFGYGNRITLTLANGFKFFFGHVAAGANGPVAAGQEIGVTGHDIGSSRGAVTLVEVHDPEGRVVNPHTYLDPIFQGIATPDSLFGPGSAAVFGAYAGSATGPAPSDSSTSSSGGGGLNWKAAFDTLVADLQAAPAEAGHNAAVQAAGVESLASSASDIASGNFIRKLLPTPQHTWRAVFVILGLSMIGIGALMYFKGDQIVAQIRAVPGEVEEAGADAASVAAPEAAPAIQSAKRSREAREPAAAPAATPAPQPAEVAPEAAAAA